MTRFPEGVSKPICAQEWLGLSIANPQKSTIRGLTSFDPRHPTWILRLLLLSAFVIVFSTSSTFAQEAGKRTNESGTFSNVMCEGTYRHHLQGICTNDKNAIYWSFTTALVKTDATGKVHEQIPVGNHHGDLCHHDGRIYVAVNFGRFNDPNGNSDSWVYVYDADDLSLIAKHETAEVFHGAGGIGYRDGRFFVVGGLPDGVQENYVYEYDPNFNFVKKHVIKSGHTHLGIQTAAFANGQWWFGCYGNPKIMLTTDASFKMKGRYEFDCSLGVVGLPNGQFLAASGRTVRDKGCTGWAALAVEDRENGFRIPIDFKR